ncbi:hypothetical protein [Nocardioides lijunqiniae]|uniref:hypothetical protein n=1 Tax=Nocardioides lijunqiniae TaxID=2760832 RepID=UPI001878AB4F|nr:hypothetical protein [Nocardioides lijunqiniae]
MNDPLPPSVGQGGFPPPGQPPHTQPPKGPRTGLTLALLGAGLVLVLVVIGVVALVVRGDGSDKEDDTSGGAHEASCEVYADVVLNSQIWAATEFDPDKLQEAYDAALADISDDEIAALVKEEATVTVAYYQALQDWKQGVDDALAQGQTPDTEIPAEISSQQAEIPKAQGAVIQACQGVYPDRDEPLPSITAPTLETPTWMDEK